MFVQLREKKGGPIEGKGSPGLTYVKNRERARVSSRGGIRTASKRGLSRSCKKTMVNGPIQSGEGTTTNHSNGLIATKRRGISFPQESPEEEGVERNDARLSPAKLASRKKTIKKTGCRTSDLHYPSGTLFKQKNPTIRLPQRKGRGMDSA